MTSTIYDGYPIFLRNLFGSKKRTVVRTKRKNRCTKIPIVDPVNFRNKPSYNWIPSVNQKWVNSIFAAPAEGWTSFPEDDCPIMSPE